MKLVFWLTVVILFALVVEAVPRGSYEALNQREFVWSPAPAVAAAGASALDSRDIPIEKPTFIPLGAKQIASGNLFSAYTYIWKRLYQSKSVLISLSFPPFFSNFFPSDEFDSKITHCLVFLLSELSSLNTLMHSLLEQKTFLMVQ